MAKSLHLLLLVRSLFLFLVLYVLESSWAIKISSSSQSLSHELNECSLLLDFKNIMSINSSASSDPISYPKIVSWKHNRSEGKSYCCLWDGVECSECWDRTYEINKDNQPNLTSNSEKTSGHVIVLDLSSSFLYGTINSTTSLFSLIHLRRLNLADNDFHFSQIPSGIGRLSQLAYLNLSYSVFSGYVPKEISQLNQLVSLDLERNPLLELQGPVFRNLVQNATHNLKELFLSKVNIDSQVPNILANSSSLRSLVLGDCGLHGEFPTSIFHLPKPQLLDLQDNSDLTGYLPKFHANSQLKSLVLAKTNFHGKVPSSIGNLVHLERLDVSSCFFLGTLPGSVGNLTQFTYLNLYNNSFFGQIPSLASLSKLSYLKLSFNQFEGRNLSEWLGKLPKLSYLDLRENNLSCEIPSSIGNQTQLKQLYLNYNNMVGQIPSSIMNLTHLTDLILGYNKFTGFIPSLESLSNLTQLFLTGNNFDRWKLPDWLGKLNKLTYVQLDAVNLYGEIPSSVFNLTQVGGLSLSSNQIEGPIPPFPNTMTKITLLDLAQNRLKGPIPSSLSNLKNLEIILLNDNNISGTVEADIFLSLKKLKALYLGGNKITLSVNNHHTTDTLPKFEILWLESCNLRVFPDFLRFQDQLQELYLDSNKIDGLIPEWMGNTSKETLQTLSLSKNSIRGFEQRSPIVPWVSLQELDLSHNMLQGSIPVPPPTTIIFMVSNNTLTGEIPPSICELQSLQVLDLSFNNVIGSITPCLKKLSNSLLVLNLRGNAFQGIIPNIFNNGSNLQVINLSENQLEGQLPRSLENCASLMILDLRGNTLRGTVPNIFTNGCKLQMIDLSENELEGQLPRPLETCTSLQILNLGNNHMEDMFPFWLGALSELRVLILRFNKFHGAIRIPSKTNSKFPKLHIIDLSHNSFYGNLPNQYFQEWLAMKETESNGGYMETFNLTVGNYSYSMKFVNKGVNMKYEKIINSFIAIDLSSNKFKGMIPESIKSLSGLRSLNLSNNELSGAIPSSMRNLTLLESLDLSNNKLSGKMPQQLTQLNFLEFLNVSYNNLDGVIPQGGQFNTFSNISYMGNLALCGDPLSKKCGNSETSKSLAVSLNKDIESDFPSAVDWVVILSGVASGLVIGLLFGNHLAKTFYEWMLQGVIKRD